MIESFIDGRFQQRFKLMHAVFYLGACLGVFEVAICIRYGEGRGKVITSEPEGLGWYLKQTILESLDGLVDDGVYCIDDVVNQ